MRKAAVDIRNVPDGIRDAVDAEARARACSIADVITDALGQWYGVDVALTGYPYTQTSGTNHWNVRMTVALRDAVRAHADAVEGTVTGVILYVLAARYGLPRPPVAGRRHVRLSPAQLQTARERRAGGESLARIAAEYGVKPTTLSRRLKEEAA